MCQPVEIWNKIHAMADILTLLPLFTLHVIPTKKNAKNQKWDKSTGGIIQSEFRARTIFVIFIAFCYICTTMQKSAKVSKIFFEGN